MKKIILATTSPYRKQAFQLLGLEFEAEGSNVDEKFDGRPDNPEELVKHLAKLKAESVAKNHSEGIVIGFDSVGWFNNSVLEKPQSKEEAFERLKSLSGNGHDFYTGIHIIDVSSGKVISDVVKTTVEIRELSDAEINKYLDQDPRFNTYALGYDPLGNYSSSFARSIQGSYNNLLRGIPTEMIIEKLKEFDVKI
ncbi:septum formation protein Maf [bacterium BMS3Abin15]|nr:septum formation protein Maf [bacterium BMS3Abin15]HDZ85186.1 Maf-like protein [Candidatus Moranbacteria bacterium]